MSPTAAPAHRFDDSTAYERFMGAWSRAATPIFLDWLAAPRQARWLDLGCGTGALSECIIASQAPAEVHAVDPARAQVEAAARKLDKRVTFEVGRAESLPFGSGRFDVVASALVINFIADRPQAAREMRRVACGGGLVGGFVWDFANERSPTWPMREALRRMGKAVPDVPGTSESTEAALRRLFVDAGFEAVATTVYEVTVSFTDLESYWESQTPGYSPVTQFIRAMSESDRALLRRTLHDVVPRRGGRIEYAARANAVKAVKKRG